MRSAPPPASTSPLAFAAIVFLLTTTGVLGGTLLLRRSGEPPRDPVPEEGLLQPAAGDSEEPPSQLGTDPPSPTNSLADRVEATHPRLVTPDFGRTAFEERLMGVYREARRSVVHVTSHWYLRNHTGTSQANVPAGSGSGFVWDENGYIVTSYGIVNGVDGAYVRLFDGSVWPARMVGDSREYDIALLYIEAPRNLLRPVAIGGGIELEVGQGVLGLGNPTGEEVLLLTGFLAGTDQVLASSSTTRVMRGMLLTDLALGKGMAGGPLFDSGGRLIGLRASIVSGPGTSLAIPVELVNRVVPRIIREGHVPWPELGLVFAPTSTANRLDVEGVVVLEVVEGGPAQRVGIRSMVFERPGVPRDYDLVVGIDEQPVRNRADVDAALVEHKPGELVALDVRRGEDTLRFFVPLQ